MSIWIDGKNPALYSGGISAWLNGLLLRFDEKLLSRIVLVSPNAGNSKIYPELKVNRLNIPWLGFLPSKFRHFVYDQITFRLFVKFKRVHLVFSPYFDLSVPKQVRLIITVHDLCYLEVPNLYSKIQVSYYKRALMRNVDRAIAIVTVSQSSKQSLVSKLKIDPSKILVIPNRLDDEFAHHIPNDNEVNDLKQRLANGEKMILYTSGFENRKNIPNLIQALRELLSSGLHFRLVVTGESKVQWMSLLGHDLALIERITFVGFLSIKDLKKFYCAADVVVYPSLSEGFGRACLEAMNAGTPLACSKLPVFQEVAGNYAQYFSPSNSKEIANAIKIAIQQGRRVDSKPFFASNNEDFEALQSLIFGKSLST